MSDTKVENNVFPSLGIKFCVGLQSTEVSDYRVQRFQITEVVFYAKVLVNDILVRLERILDYTDVRLERFDYTPLHCYITSYKRVQESGK